MTVWYDRSYRLPLAGFEAQSGAEPRRADFVVWALVQARALRAADIRQPARASYADLARVHTHDYLDSLQQPTTLARIFALDESEIQVDPILGIMRLSCGATLAAAREGLERRTPLLNLLGGFHHAGRASGGGLCALNDIAVAAAALRHDGFAGRINVIDLDAHPPDGTADCLAGDDRTWIGSLSGCDWGPLPGVDETVLTRGCSDAAYLEALHALLERMPRAELAFVIAGGDVLAGDQLGHLALTVAGARERDREVLRALAGAGSVWLPGGGYHADAWKILAGTGLVLAGRGAAPLPSRDPLAESFAAIAAQLDARSLGGEASADLDLSELEAELWGRPRQPRVLGFYTAEGVEHALQRYRILELLERLGYAGFRVAVDDKASVGDRIRVWGRAGGAEHLLIEVVVERRLVGGSEVLYIHWLTLRHPRARFVSGRNSLPGQEVPGLGLAREIGELLLRMAMRLGLAGVAFRPAWYHMAYAARDRFRFVDPARQARFEALVGKLAGVALPAATLAVAGGKIELDGKPYRWEPDEMVAWLAAAVTARPAAPSEPARP